jgi:hypothetical protein
MKLLRSAIFALLLVLAQSAALLHSVDHLKPDADAAGGYACVFCLAVHGLDSPVPSLAKVVVEPLLPVAPLAQAACSSCAPRLRQPCARAPPAA